MLTELLIKKKSSIITNWIQQILDSWPTETKKYLSLEKNQFSNPIGFTISNNIEKIYEVIIGDGSINEITPLLDEIIKIRAVQELSASQAIDFVFLVKKVVRDELSMEIHQENIFDELFDFDSSIDRIALRAFDLYQESREKVFQLRVKEIKSNFISTLT